MVSRGVSLRPRGLSLLELLVGLALGLGVVGTVVLYGVSASRSARLHAALVQMTEDAQLALQLLATEVRMAGYAAPTALVAGTDGLPRWQTALSAEALVACDFGFVAPSVPGAPACAATGSSAALAVRYQADLHNTVPLSRRAEPSDCLGHGLGSGPGPHVTDNRWYVARSEGRSELRCASRLGHPGQPLIEHVETMALWFGQADAGDPGRPVRYVSAAEAGDLARVRSVRICLLLRSGDPVLGPEDAAEYLDCQGQRQRSADGRLRRAFHATVALRSGVP